MTEETFKSGDRVVKFAPYTRLEYCRFGGTSYNVPIGTPGTVRSASSDHTKQATVQFDNGVCWSVDYSEITKNIKGVEKLYKERERQKLRDLERQKKKKERYKRLHKESHCDTKEKKVPEVIKISEKAYKKIYTLKRAVKDNCEAFVVGINGWNVVKDIEKIFDTDCHSNGCEHMPFLPDNKLADAIDKLIKNNLKLGGILRIGMFTKGSTDRGTRGGIMTYLSSLEIPLISLSKYKATIGLFAEYKTPKTRIFTDIPIAVVPDGRSTKLKEVRNGSKSRKVSSRS